MIITCSMPLTCRPIPIRHTLNVALPMRCYGKVVAAAQWALPQVDVYVGVLAPFRASITFTEGSSRSNVAGRRLLRHSKPNGGSAFGVAGDTLDGDDSFDLQEDAQVGEFTTPPGTEGTTRRQRIARVTFTQRYVVATLIGGQLRSNATVRVLDGVVYSDPRCPA